MCANNLLRLVRGEVPFDRVKGLDPRIIDLPEAEAKPEMDADAAWLIETFEPRVQFNGIKVAHSNSVNGGLVVTANVTEKEG